MNADELTRRLRAADPASSLPPGESSETIRRAVLSGERSSSPSIRAPRRHPRSLVVIVAIGLILLLGGSAYGTSLLLDWPAVTPAGLSPDEVVQQFHEWTAKIELPPGATWHDPLLLPDTRYGSREGAAEAVMQAMGDWATEWMAAAKAGDHSRVDTAKRELAALRAAIPVAGSENSENGGTIWDTSTADYYDAIIAAALKGDVERLKWVAQWGHKIDPAWFWAVQRHQVIFSAGGPTATPLRTPRQFLAEYRRAQRVFDLPPGRTWPARPYVPPRYLPDNLPMEKGSGRYEAAMMISWAYWWQEWVDAATNGDGARVEAADAASVRLERLLPHTPAGQAMCQHTWLALDDRTIADFHTVVAAARRGDLKPMKDWLWVQHAWLTMK